MSTLGLPRKHSRRNPDRQAQQEKGAIVCARCFEPRSRFMRPTGVLTESSSKIVQPEIQKP